MRIVTLVFNNKDATPKKTSMVVADINCADIALWYGSHHAGDDYTIRVDGKKMKQGINGEIDGS